MAELKNSDRRYDARMSCYLRGEIWINNSLEAIPCEVHDISQKGMRLTGGNFNALPNVFTLRIPRRRFHEQVKIVRRLPHGGVGVIILSAL
jgi:hypothetical protein